ncbi:MAG: hypothetical protein OEZ00_01100 [Dehalococcoidia bacterium]|nr:hypothetical protein [Dehalococcoidia bacterium]
MAIVAKCPVCKGVGRIAKQLPFRANPKAPATHTDKLGMVICPRCKGRGRIGVE